MIVRQPSPAAEVFNAAKSRYDLLIRDAMGTPHPTAAQQRELDESLKQAKAKVVESSKSIDQASARVREVQARLQLAILRVQQNRELATTGAGSKFELEKSETDVKELQAQLDSARGVEAQARAAEVQARASQEQVQQKLSARVEGEYAQVATDPGQGFHFHTGRRLARLLGYEEAWLDGVPEGTVAAFAGTGNPFALGPVRPGERVTPSRWCCGASRRSR